MELPPKEAFPRHIGIIMDGNGRWAEKRGLPRSEGHSAGAKVFRSISDHAYDIGIECVTFYAFSTENWKRPVSEVRALMKLFKEYLVEAEDIMDERQKRGYCLRFIGDIGSIPSELTKLCNETETDITDKTKTIINIALNYGGRDEIIHSAKKLAEKVQAGEIKPDDINEELFENELYTKGMPPVDLIIRPSGEYRISNFMLWQSAYAEFWYSDILWPDFTTDDFDKAICDYAQRNRRFGGV